MSAAPVIRCAHDKDARYCVQCHTTPEQREEYARTGRVGGSGRGRKWLPGEDWDSGKGKVRR